MSAIRRVICEKVSQITKHNNIYHELEVPSKKLYNVLTKPTLHWTIKHQTQTELIDNITKLKFDYELIKSVRFLPAVGKTEPKLEFELQPQAFVEELLCSDENALTENIPHHGRVVIDFSSPNIAKPFHVGHLRSTIIGNVLGNLHEHLGYAVTKLNYLGDWGTQFGLLQVGVELLGITDEQICVQPIQTLYNAYVAANQAAKQDATIAEKARSYFTVLETGSDAEMLRQWQQYREYTIAELEQVYARLGVHFDQYDWESQYSQQQIGNILQRLVDKSLLFDEHDGRKIVQVDDRRVPIIKSDGSSLYLARDIAALVDRYQRFQFERMLYVVDNAQTDHFNACFKTTTALCSDITHTKIKHVKFGRIHGMSTRSGNVIFLRDVLDEARDIMLEKQLKSPNTKIELSTDSSDAKKVADVLGVSAVLVNDLKQRRQRDYDFDWQKALQVNGDTGIKLQYTHCRLHSLMQNNDAQIICGIRPAMQHLSEPEAQDLLYEIARFEQCVWMAKEQLEACILVNHLFALCNAASRALKRLNVKNETCLEKQQNRLLLFNATKRILSKGMQILGLRPLNKM